MIDESPSHELILRDHLAMDRTRLANERTLLAYQRTSLMLLVAGATAVKFVAESMAIIATGWLLMGLGIFVGVVGGQRFLVMRRSIERRTSAVQTEGGLSPQVTAAARGHSPRNRPS